MTVLILLPVFVILACLVLVAPVLSRLLRPSTLDEITPEWLEQFSPSNYYPMEALLSNEDFGFLTRQPGFDFSLYRKLRRERMTIFRQYLRRLIADFNRLHRLARLVVATSSTDRSHLASRLFVLRWRFSLSVLQAEISYYFCLIGSHSLVAHKTIAVLEEMNSELKAVGSLLPSATV